MTNADRYGAGEGGGIINSNIGSLPPPPPKKEQNSSCIHTREGGGGQVMTHKPPSGGGEGGISNVGLKSPARKSKVLNQGSEMKPDIKKNNTNIVSPFFCLQFPEFFPENLFFVVVVLLHFSFLSGTQSL